MTKKKLKSLLGSRPQEATVAIPTAGIARRTGIVMASILMASLVMASLVMASIVMAYIVMAYIVTNLRSDLVEYSDDPHSYGR